MSILLTIRNNAYILNVVKFENADSGV